MQKIDVAEQIKKLVLECDPESTQMRSVYLDLLREAQHSISDIDWSLLDFPNWEHGKITKDKDKLLQIHRKYCDNNQIDKYPVSAYLTSLGEAIGTKNEQIAYQWAYANVLVMLEIVELNEEYIKLLCRKFRMAHISTSNNAWIFGELPTLPSSLSAIVEALKTLEEKYEQLIENSSKRKATVKSKQVTLIRRSYEAVLLKKNRIIRPRDSNPKTDQDTKTPDAITSDKQPEEVPIQDTIPNDEPFRTTYHSDDDDEYPPMQEIIFHEQEATAGVDYKESFYDGPREQLVDTNFQTVEGTENSAEQQTFALDTQVLHIQRNSFEHPTSLKVLNLSDSQRVFKALWQGFIQPNSISKLNNSQAFYNFKHLQIIDTCLLMSFLTGSPAVIWLDYQGLINQNKIFYSEKREQLFWFPEIDITNFYLTELNDLKLNKHKKFSLPLPNKAIHILADSDPPQDKMPNRESLKERVNVLRKELDLPLLSPERIRTTLHSTIRRHLGDHYIADLICNTSPHHSPGLFYSSFELPYVEKVYRETVLLLADKTVKFHKNYLKPNYLPDSCGSQITPVGDLASDFLKQLAKVLDQQKDPLARFNYYSIWMWHIIMLLTSCRPVDHMPGMLNQIDHRARFIWLSDKEIRATSSSGRFIPMCDYLNVAIQDYRDYLDRFSRKYGVIDIQTDSVLQGIKCSKLPLLYLKHEDEWVPISPKLVLNYIKDLFPYPLNWTRHFGRYYLADKLPVYLIDAIFAHEAPAHETLNQHSSVSLLEIKSTAQAYDQMAKDLKLERIFVDVD